MNNIIKKVQEKLSGFNQKTRYFILGGIGGFIILLDIILIMVPQVMSISKLSVKNKTHEDNITQLKNNQARMVQYKQQLREISSEIESSTIIVRSEKEVPIVLEKISRLAKEFSVKIDQVMPLKETKRQLVQNEDGTYHALSISVKAQGGYHEFGRFLNAMEKAGMFMKVQEMLLEIDPRNKDEHQFKLVVDIIVLEEKA